MVKTADTKTWTARHCFARISPRKARLVADLIRDRQVGEALDVLKFTRKRASTFVGNALKSAMANADEDEADMGRLYVKEVRVDNGPIIKRWRPKDRGRSHPINKRTSHIVIKVREM